MRAARSTPLGADALGRSGALGRRRQPRGSRIASSRREPSAARLGELVVALGFVVAVRRRVAVLERLGRLRRRVALGRVALGRVAAFGRRRVAPRARHVLVERDALPLSALPFAAGLALAAGLPFAAEALPVAFAGLAGGLLGLGLAGLAGGLSLVGLGALFENSRRSPPSVVGRDSPPAGPPSAAPAPRPPASA